MTLPFLPAHHHQMGPSLYLDQFLVSGFSLLFPRARFFGICFFRFLLGSESSALFLRSGCCSSLPRPPFLWHFLFDLLLVQNLRFWLLLPTQVVVLLLPRPPVWHLPLPILLLVQNLRFCLLLPTQVVVLL